MRRLLSESLEVCGIFQKMIMKPIWYSSTSLHTVYIRIYTYTSYLNHYSRSREIFGVQKKTNMIKKMSIPSLELFILSSPKVIVIGTEGFFQPFRSWQRWNPRNQVDGCSLNPNRSFGPAIVSALRGPLDSQSMGQGVKGEGVWVVQRVLWNLGGDVLVTTGFFGKELVY